MLSPEQPALLRLVFLHLFGHLPLYAGNFLLVDLLVVVLKLDEVIADDHFREEDLLQLGCDLQEQKDHNQGELNEVPRAKLLRRVACGVLAEYLEHANQQLNQVHHRLS